MSVRVKIARDYNGKHTPTLTVTLVGPAEYTETTAYSWALAVLTAIHDKLQESNKR